MKFNPPPPVPRSGLIQLSDHHSNSSCRYFPSQRYAVQVWTATPNGSAGVLISTTPQEYEIPRDLDSNDRLQVNVPQFGDYALDITLTALDCNICCGLDEECGTELVPLDGRPSFFGSLPMQDHGDPVNIELSFDDCDCC